MEPNYEVDNPQLKSILRDISSRIRSALPQGWGFLLMLFEFGKNGANFYMSNAERDDAVNMMLEWIEKTTGSRPVVELNPEQKVTSKLHGQWEKVCAVLLHKMGGATITKEDLDAIAAFDSMPTIKADDKPDGLHLEVVTRAEAERLARAEKGTLL